MTISIRVATPADAPILSGFAADTFRETFGNDNDPADLESYISTAFNEERQRAEIDDPLGVVLLAEIANPGGAMALAGYGHLVQSEAPPPIGGRGAIELKRLYVGSEWQGRGVAQSLMDAALAAARARAVQTMWLGVWERNPRAVAFYRKFGFERVGEHTFLLGRDPQTDWVMAREVGPGAPPTGLLRCEVEEAATAGERPRRDNRK